MVDIAESLGEGSPLNAAEVAGYAQLSRNQKVTFIRYLRVVLPLDGFVFWVRADLLSASAVLNSTALNAAQLNAPQKQLHVADRQTLLGSLHYAATAQQAEDEDFSINQVVFTTSTEIQDLNAVPTNVLYIGEFWFPPENPALVENPCARKLRFAFSRQGRFYQAAGIYHYSGNAIYPAMESQIIDSLAGFDGRSLVVSNSLPAWLALGAAPQAIWQAPRQMFPVFPSYAVPNNMTPPYAAVHIDPDGTEAIGAAPYVDGESSQFQLTSDRVRITFYGLRNDAVRDFLLAVNQFSVNTDVFGLMSMAPAIRDHKRPQVEMDILAMKKTAEFQVSYYQSRVNDFAVQTIKSAIPSFVIG